VSAITAFVAIPVAALASSATLRIWWFAVLAASSVSWPFLHFGPGERVTVFVELMWLLWLYPNPVVVDGDHREKLHPCHLSPVWTTPVDNYLNHVTASALAAPRMSPNGSPESSSSSQHRD
jgi:hypothetical protein